MSPLSPDVSCDRMLAREMEKRDKEVRKLREQHEFELLRVSVLCVVYNSQICLTFGFKVVWRHNSVKCKIGISEKMFRENILRNQHL